jgi:hypothetical protein
MKYKIQINVPGHSDKLIITFDKTNIHIVDSYKIATTDDMQYVLQIVRYAASNYDIIYNRTTNSWIQEWQAHNMLYNLNIRRSSTKDVDINEDELKWRKIGYFILSLFYWK